MTTRHCKHCAVAENKGNGGICGAWGCHPACLALPVGLAAPAWHAQRLPSFLALWAESSSAGALPRASCSTRKGKIFPLQGPAQCCRAWGCSLAQRVAGAQVGWLHQPDLPIVVAALSWFNPFIKTPTRCFLMCPLQPCSPRGLCLRSLPLPMPSGCFQSHFCRCFEVTATLALPSRALINF